VDVHCSTAEAFRVTLVDAGLSTKTAGHLKRVQKYIGDDDGVSNGDLKSPSMSPAAQEKCDLVTGLLIVVVVSR
jgi:hypothetical protein